MNIRNTLSILPLVGLLSLATSPVMASDNDGHRSHNSSSQGSSQEHRSQPVNPGYRGHDPAVDPNRTEHRYMQNNAYGHHGSTRYVFRGHSPHHDRGHHYGHQSHHGHSHSYSYSAPRIVHHHGYYPHLMNNLRFMLGLHTDNVDIIFRD